MNDSDNDQHREQRSRPRRRATDEEGQEDHAGSADASDEKGTDDGGKDAEQKKDRPSPLKKPWVRITLVVVAAFLLVAGGIWLFRWWTHGRFVESTNDAYLQADQVVVSAKVAGTVEEVFVADNQSVRVGDPLVRIDASSSQARVEQARAQVGQARATIAQYEAQIREQQATIDQAVATVGGAEAQRRYNQTEVDRYAPLAASGAESAEKLSQMTSNRDQAVATLRQNEASATQARRRIATLHAQVAVAEAQAVQAEAQAKQAQVDVDSSLIRASIDGRVGDRQARVGLAAQVGTRLLTVVPVQSVYLVANFKETQIGLMREGQPASIKVDALDGDKIDGTVDSFSPATGATFALIPANNATGNFTKIVQRVPVRIRIDAGPEARKVLVPGLSVVVAVDTLGQKDDRRRRERETSDEAERRAQRHDQEISRDREAPSPGAGK